jgi:hypothetical protein
MRHTTNRLWFCGVSLCWLLVWLLPLPLLLGAEQNYPATEETRQGADFVLTRQGDRFSLHAQQASLRDIVKTLGAMLAIEVVARIPQDTRITLDFAGLSLKDAFQRLRTFANIVYLTETTQPASKIIKIFVMPIQGAQRITQPTVPSGVERPPPTGSPPKPFKFEFDPSKHRERQP